jgi:hypothetical protein
MLGQPCGVAGDGTGLSVVNMDETTKTSVKPILQGS